MLFCSWSTKAEETGVSAVDASQFRAGNYWVWLYSEFNSFQGVWKPYLEERYTLTAVRGSSYTFEMSSAGVGSLGRSEAHHKFVVDFKKCELEQRNPTYRYWTVHFYTRAYTGAWELVSAVHPNLVFTEKFNCALHGKRARNKFFAFLGEKQEVFQRPRAGEGETSWYFVNHPYLKGVAAFKYFEPDFFYKQELLEFGIK